MLHDKWVEDEDEALTARKEHNGREKEDKNLIYRRHPSRHEFVIDFIHALMMRQQLLVHERSGSLLDTAGGGQVVALDETAARNLPRLALATHRIAVQR